MGQRKDNSRKSRSLLLYCCTCINLPFILGHGFLGEARSYESLQHSRSSLVLEVVLRGSHPASGFVEIVSDCGLSLCMVQAIWSLHRHVMWRL